MPTSDSTLLIATQILVGDITMGMKPTMYERTEMRLNRIATVLIAGGSLYMALFFKTAYEALMSAWPFYAAIVGLPALASLYWKEAAKYGILAGRRRQRRHNHLEAARRAARAWLLDSRLNPLRRGAGRREPAHLPKSPVTHARRGVTQIETGRERMRFRPVFAVF